MSFVVIILILLIILLFLFMPVGVGIKYENGAFIVVKISIFSFNISLEKILISFQNKKEKKPEKSEDDIEKNIDKSITDIDFIISLFGDFRRFVRKRFTLDGFNLTVDLGTAEAASTAVLTGMLYSFTYSILGLLDQLIYVKKPKVDITPKFNDATFKLALYGIIKARLVHIIATAIVFKNKLYKYKKQKEEEN